MLGIWKRTGRKLLGFLGSENGGPGAEFALVLTPMVVIFLVIIQFGIVLFVYNDMYNAAHDAVRQMASNEVMLYSNGTADAYLTEQSQACDGTYAPISIEAAACYQMSQWSGFMNFTVRIDVDENVGAAVCDTFRVTMAIPMAEAAIFNVFGFFDSLQLEAVAIMRSQYDVVEGGSLMPPNPFCT